MWSACTKRASVAFRTPARSNGSRAASRSMDVERRRRAWNIPQPRTSATGVSQATVEIALHEGRKHQVRRMFEAVGHPVVRLRRIRIGPIEDESLTTGHYRDLTARELATLRRAAGVDDRG